MRFDYHVFVMTVGFAHYVWSNIMLHISPANTMCEYYLALKHKRCIQHNKLSFLETPRLRQNLSEYYFSKKKEIWHISFCRTMRGQQLLRHTLPSLLNGLLSKGAIPPETCSLVDLRSALSI